MLLICFVFIPEMDVQMVQAEQRGEVVNVVRMNENQKPFRREAYFRERVLSLINRLMEKFHLQMDRNCLVSGLFHLDMVETNI